MSNRINKQDFAAVLVEKGLYETKKAAIEGIEAFTDAIQEIVVAGDTLTIPGFGKFECFTRANESKAPKFRPFDQFKSAVSGKV
jgi:nucleoid DNA-binding protein